MLQCWRSLSQEEAGNIADIMSRVQVMVVTVVEEEQQFGSTDVSRGASRLPVALRAGDPGVQAGAEVEVALNRTRAQRTLVANQGSMGAP